MVELAVRTIACGSAAWCGGRQRRSAPRRAARLHLARALVVPREAERGGTAGRCEDSGGRHLCDHVARVLLVAAGERVGRDAGSRPEGVGSLPLGALVLRRPSAVVVVRRRHDVARVEVVPAAPVFSRRGGPAGRPRQSRGCCRALAAFGRSASCAAPARRARDATACSSGLLRRPIVSITSVRTNALLFSASRRNADVIVCPTEGEG